MPIKSEAGADLVDAVQQVEVRADRAVGQLDIFRHPRDLAAWGVLSRLSARFEGLRPNRSPRQLAPVAINLSRSGALLLWWLQQRGRAPGEYSGPHRMTRDLEHAAERAIEIALRYDAFQTSLPAWHKGRASAEVLSDGAVRLTVVCTPLERRVRAFQQGFPACGGSTQGDSAHAGFVSISAAQERLMTAALGRCFFAGGSSMAYPEPRDLYQSLFRTYLGRMEAMFRRSDSLDLGAYTMADFKQFYSAFLAALAVHEDLCFRFGARHSYPHDSAVMVRERSGWADLCASVSGLRPELCAAIFDDLTFADQGPRQDLSTCPAVPVGGGDLAIVPLFPLAARADENILRVIQRKRRPLFSESSRLKEKEMAGDIGRRVRPGLGPTAPVRLPNGLPDIDLLFVDEGARAVLIAESKWLQKPSGNWGRWADREKEIRKGEEQLAKIRGFLRANPQWLSDRGRLGRPIRDYKVHFAIVARDFFVPPAKPEIFVTDHEALITAMNAARDLGGAVASLRSYGWLPVEGKDFRVQFDRAAVGGAVIEVETYYPLERGPAAHPE